MLFAPCASCTGTFPLDAVVSVVKEKGQRKKSVRRVQRIQSLISGQLCGILSVSRKSSQIEILLCGERWEGPRGLCVKNRVCNKEAVLGLECEQFCRIIEMQNQQKKLFLCPPLWGQRKKKKKSIPTASTFCVSKKKKKKTTKKPFSCTIKKKKKKKIQTF